MRAALLAYLALLAYGSWYPFVVAPPQLPWLDFLHAPLPAHVDKGDVLQNVLVYMPFGLLFVQWHSARRPGFAAALLLAALAGTLFSLGVEVAQQYMPSRVASLLDVLMNCAGTVLGGLLAQALNRHTLTGATVLRWRDARFRPGPLADAGLLAIALWALSQTSPLVPSLDIAHLRHGVGQLLGELMQPAAASGARLFTAACHLAAIGLLLNTLQRGAGARWRAPALLIAAVLACKLVVVGRQLSVEVLAGAVLALLALPALSRLPARAMAAAAIALLAAGLVVYELTPAPGGYRFAFNWVPFLGQMHGLGGFGNILEFLWPCMAMAVLARDAAPPHWQAGLARWGTLAVALLLFAMEWRQQALGRHGDITQVMLACAGWLGPWCVSAGGLPGRWRAAPAADVVKP